MIETTGQVIRDYGRRFIVETANPVKQYECTARAKRVDFACGDQVHIRIQNDEQAVITQHYPRTNVLYRQDKWKSKTIATNVSRLLFVMAAEPSPSEELLNRCLITAEASDIEPIILVNKMDLSSSAGLWQHLQYYHNVLGYTLIGLSATADISALLPIIEGQTSVLVGQSGMGKSTIINALLPDACSRTGEISTALDSGKHTTTYSALYHVNSHTHLIDSPGLQAFGLHHIPVDQLAACFPEMRQYIGQCRFHNCRHIVEPGCAIIHAYEQEKIQFFRLRIMHKLINEHLIKS